MAKQLAEDEVNIRRKQRRRLVGAVVLTLAVVVVLPMILESEPKSMRADIDLRIPDPNNAGEFILGVDAAEKKASLSVETSVDTPVPPVAPPAALNPSAAVEVKETLPAKTTSDTVSTVQHAAPGKTTAAPPTSPKTVIPATGTPQTGYVAQVGAYANADAAKQELAKLKQWGFKAYTEKAGDKVRVRVGPYASREKAEAAGRSLEKRGMHPVIMTAK